MLTKKKGIQRRKKILIISLFVGIFIVLFYNFSWNEEVEAQDSDCFSVRLYQLKTVTLSVGKMVKIENVFRLGDTIINVLKRDGVGHNEAFQFFQQIKPVYDLRSIAAGKEYILYMLETQNGRKIRRFDYVIDDNHRLEVRWHEEKKEFIGKIVTIPFVVRRRYIRGSIQESLVASIIRLGEKPELADLMASLFEYDIDFNRDIQDGDTYHLLVEKMFLNGEFIRYGNGFSPLLTKINNHGQSFEMFVHCVNIGVIFKSCRVNNGIGKGKLMLC